jgi:hypothetical protein
LAFQPFFLVLVLLRLAGIGSRDADILRASGCVVGDDERGVLRARIVGIVGHVNGAGLARRQRRRTAVLDREVVAIASLAQGQRNFSDRKHPVSGVRQRHCLRSARLALDAGEVNAGRRHRGDGARHDQREALADSSSHIAGNETDGIRAHGGGGAAERGRTASSGENQPAGQGARLGNSRGWEASGCHGEGTLHARPEGRATGAGERGNLIHRLCQCS